MNVLLVSHNFPPESNALANRAHEHARYWVAGGGHVEVLTDVPSFPEGKVYDGYRNRYARETLDGVIVHRCPLLPLENRGVARRTILYASFMLSAVWHSRRLQRTPDVIVASSPHLLAGLAGWAISRLRGIPFVLEVRDLWPESVVAVDALPPDHWMVRAGSAVADRLYRTADGIVVVTRTFRRTLLERGVDPGRLAYVPNGVDPDAFQISASDAELERLRGELDLDGRFVASYLGTVGKAHRADVLYEAACHSDDELAFLVAGPGSEWRALRQRQLQNPLPNFRLLPKQPKSRIPLLLALSHVSIVHLKDRPLFRTVLPSKIFEAMAAGNPIVLGVRGEAAEMISEADAGIPVAPESPQELVEAVRRLRDDRQLYHRMSQNGRQAVRERFNRAQLAEEYWTQLEGFVARARAG
ncbi:MAG: glycosyltransferase family 4 protein, partial [Acidobacteriota bacterium]